MKTLIIVIIIVIVIVALAGICSGGYLHHTNIQFVKAKESFEKSCKELDEQTTVPPKPAQSKVILAALMYNCESNVDLVRELATTVDADHVIILENNSQDKTRAKLRGWQRHDSRLMLPRVQMDNGHHRGKSCSRISRMVRLRNALLTAVRSVAGEPWCSDVTIMLDGDLPLVYSEKLLLRKLREFSTDTSKKAALSPNIRKTVRSRPNKSFLRDPFAFAKTSMDEVTEHSIDGDKVEHVLSAFGGLTLYRTRCLMIPELLYQTEVSSNDDCVCEHVGFNAKLGGVDIDWNWKNVCV